MPFFKSLPENAGPPNVFKQHPEIYGHWSVMSQALMNGPSSLALGEREVILAFAAGVAGCDFVYVGHSEVAYAWGAPRGSLDALLTDFDAAPFDQKLKSLLAYLRKLILSPLTLCQADADRVFASGWDEQALHDAIAISARAAFMQRLVTGFDFAPLDPAVAASHAKKRVERGYVDLYRAFRQPT